LFLQRDKGKRTEITGTQIVGILKTYFLHYITIKMVLVILHYQNNFKHNSCLVHLCYLEATSTRSKLQFFQRWREWEWNPRMVNLFLPNVISVGLIFLQLA
jgi:hypothetical protein